MTLKPGLPSGLSMNSAARRRLPVVDGESSFDRYLEDRQLELARTAVSTLQVNVGKVCNQACHHCHVEAGPKRTESMPERVARRVGELLEQDPSLRELDLTGGAPELNPNFRWLVRRARALGRTVIDRCNLTVLFEPGQADLARFLADEGVRVVASLPCYQERNVDAQRGKGVFGKSVDALLALNALGYGKRGSGLELDLVYNPLGAALPPAQAALQARYKAELSSLFGVEFNSLLTLTNMPIKRFAHALEKAGQQAEYSSLLVNHFNPATIPGLMCRSLVSVGWDGRLYDCDFNQMLELPLAAKPKTIWEVTSLQALVGSRVATAEHCFGCTAGAGSSCGGALQ
jgi:radical SAM/Cys-rich protein